MGGRGSKSTRGGGGGAGPSPEDKERAEKLAKLSPGQRAAYDAFAAAGPSGTHDRSPGRPMHRSHTARLLQDGLIKPVGTTVPEHWARRASGGGRVPTYAAVK